MNKFSEEKGRMKSLHNLEKKNISVIIPCYNSEKSIGRVVEEIIANMPQNISYEVFLVDDHSKDHVWQEIKCLCEKNENIRGISLSRNFGQQAARMAAVPYVHAEYVIFMDDDGQHPADGIFKLIAKAKEGYDIVYAHFAHKKTSCFRKIGSNFNVYMTYKLMGKPKEVKQSSFFCVRGFVVEALKEYQSPFPYLFGYFMQITRNIANVDIEHRARLEGKSGYNLKKMILLWLNGFIGFSVIPLRIASLSGCISSAVGFLLGMVSVIKKLMNPEIMLGYTSTIVIILFLGGIILLILGLVGEYIGRILMTVNRIPQYIIKDKRNFE